MGWLADTIQSTCPVQYDVYGENSSPFVNAAQSLRLTFQTDTQFNKTDKKT